MTPYASLPDRNFWRKAASKPDFGAQELYSKAFEIGTTTRIATAGSCFAQHIGRYLRASRATLLDKEPAPKGLGPDQAKRFGYGLYSARYGNIYSATQLRQLLADARSGRVHKDAIWQRDGRYYDALRPGLEPDGLATEQEVVVHRKAHLAAVKDLIKQTDLFIFTLGLTETWTHRRSGRAYPTCPGVIAGTFDKTLHELQVHTYPVVWRDLTEARRLMRRLNPEIKILLTVSPVPLAATARDAHVLTATTHSKSTLRAVAGDMAAAFEDVAYFPSYEMITGTPFRSQWLAADLRQVLPDGVDHVMTQFFASHPGLGPQEHGSTSSDRTQGTKPPDDTTADNPVEDDLVCEEHMLEAFAK